MRVLIIADDLTGALDSAVTLTGAGLRCVVARRSNDIPAALELQPDVLAVNTASRESPVAPGSGEFSAGLEGLAGGAEFVFKKIDSRLKGHVVTEVRAVAERAGLGRVLVAPAIPGQGRVVAGGQLTGTGVPNPIDIAAMFAGSGLDVDVPDTSDDADLDRALALALDGPAAPLLVGAAGLAAALARRIAAGPWAVPVVRAEAPILFAIGSHDPITVAQVERLAASGRVAVSVAPDGICPSGDDGTRLLRLVPADGRPFDARAAGARFADSMARLVAACGVRTLFGCGGETADAILGALGAGVLAIEGEVLPGVPASRILAGGRPLQVVTKSGGFGGEDALVSVLAAAERAEGAQ